MAAHTVEIQNKPLDLVADVQNAFRKKRGPRISVSKAVNMCLEKLIELKVKPEEIIK